jgi:vesicle coat complex subunit
MELENASIAAELSSSDAGKQVNALLVLLRLYSAGKDVQNYVSTVVQSVLVKSTDPLVRKLCYQLVKGCTITSKYDWYEYK